MEVEMRVTQSEIKKCWRPRCWTRGRTDSPLQPPEGVWSS